MYADTASGRAEATPGLAGTCTSCGQPCRPRCGQVNVHHWAHHARADCDPWSEPESAWHRGWKLAVPAERREVIIGPHRADVVTASGGVVELQHSAISPDVIEAREQFYGERMAWIFNVSEAFTAGRLTVHAPPTRLWSTTCSSGSIREGPSGRASGRCCSTWATASCFTLRPREIPAGTSSLTAGGAIPSPANPWRAGFETAPAGKSAGFPRRPRRHHPSRAAAAAARCTSNLALLTAARTAAGTAPAGTQATPPSSASSRRTS
jgi:hypothetical protein